jgi:hypothetical protein
MALPKINKGAKAVQTNANNFLMAVVAVMLVGAFPAFGGDGTPGGNSNIDARDSRIVELEGQINALKDNLSPAELAKLQSKLDALKQAINQSKPQAQTPGQGAKAGNGGSPGTTGDRPRHSPEQSAAQLLGRFGAGINTKTENGQTTITYEGKQVVSGPTTGRVSTRCNNDNGNEYAAAFDGNKVIWENRSGATKHLKQKNGDFSGSKNLLERSKKDQPTGGGANINVTSENGQTKVVYKGQEVFSGPTSGQVSAQAVNDNGQEYAAAFDGDKVIWENTPGAASHLKKSTESRPAGARQL